MAFSDSELGIERLLEQADWVRRLAAKLVGDNSRADDLVQETYLTALQSPPRHAGNLRAWLGSVVSNLAANGWRSDQRRVQREALGARKEALQATGELVHEARLSNDLIQAVVELPEPFKQVLLMRYFRD